MIIERIHRYEKAGVQLMLLHFSPMIEGFDRFVEKILPFVNQNSLKVVPAAE
jgi:hypothetical protein